MDSEYLWIIIEIAIVIFMVTKLIKTAIDIADPTEVEVETNTEEWA
jgi:hypothetical protein